MCGILGIFNLDGEPVSSDLLARMNAQLVHRGPDGEGIYASGSAGLAHRRLAIIDLSERARQPMLSPDSRYCITYNGEVYNFADLREELKALGYSFKSTSDTEVILHAFACWGESMLPRLNGMFAFAILDNVAGELFLARDRYGIKPLYYAQLGESFVFGSEIKALQPHPNFRSELDREALFEYMTFQNFFTDRTLWRSVKTFPAGSFARIGNNRPLQIHQYWDFSFEEPATHGSREEYREELKRLFDQSVRRQLVSDVELGTFLSSGMDSGSITATAARQLPYIKTFTVGFDLQSASGMELHFDERVQAEYMSYLFKTEHYEMVLKAGDMERALPKMAWHMEEPRVGQSYPNFYAAKLASKFCKVALAGTGGDELFGGYPWRYYRAAVNANFETYLDKYYAFWQRLLSAEEARAVFAPIWSDVKDVDTRAIFRSVFKKQSDLLTRPEDYINHSLYFESKTFLHGLFMVEDKLSMAHSLETRVPFMDNDLVDFAMRTPVSMKLGNLKEVVSIDENDPSNKIKKYFEKTQDGKLLLREAFAGNLLPSAVTQQIKQGFSAPDASWFKGESIDYVRKTLYEDASPIYQFMDRTNLQTLVGQHLEGKENRRLLIWALLSLDQCLKRFGLQ